VAAGAVLAALLVPIAVPAEDPGAAAGEAEARAAPVVEPPAVPGVAWGVDEFGGEPQDDWLLGFPFRIVPRPRAAGFPRYPRGRPVEGGFPGRQILLTFDDGPFPETTPRLLDILAREDVPAVFFLIGFKVNDIPLHRESRQLVRATLAGGHVVGNHTWAHPRLPSLGEGGWKQQIVKGHEAIRSAVGCPPTLFRAPYGRVNGAIDRYLTYRGYTRLRWTYATDEFRGHTAASLARQLLDEIRERERAGRNVGGVVLLHDGHDKSLDTAELFIRRMKAENCALLDAGDEDVWRFVDFAPFFQPIGGPAPDDSAGPPVASAEQVAAARRWCAEHESEVPEILDTVDQAPEVPEPEEEEEAGVEEPIVEPE
jgi:peptidoglycan/xylan/chitin deacetylase (PgdA/CDA1 family)